MLSESDDGVENPDVQQCEYRMGKLDFHSSGVFDRGKRFQSGGEGLRGTYRARGVTRGGAGDTGASIGLEYKGKTYECVLDTGAE